MFMSPFLKPNLNKKQIYFYHTSQFKHYKGKLTSDIKYE